MTGALVLTACSGDDDDATATDESAAVLLDEAGGEGGVAYIESDGSMDAADDMSASDTADETEPTAALPGDGRAGIDVGEIGRDVIVEMRVLLGTDDLGRSVASITASAAALGGGIASSDVDYGSEGSGGSAVLVVKVPPASLDRLLSRLDDVGQVRSINQSAQDVTDQLVDLDVRITNARRSVDSVREFMGRTENLNELVTLESELTRRQTELEQLEAQERNLSDRVALSTVTIEIVPNADVPAARTDDDTIGDAFRSGWNAFAAFFFTVAFVLATALPFISLSLLVLMAAWLITRRRARDAPHAIPGPRTATVDEREDEPVG